MILDATFLLRVVLVVRALFFCGVFLISGASSMMRMCGVGPLLPISRGLGVMRLAVFAAIPNPPRAPPRGITNPTPPGPLPAAFAQVALAFGGMFQLLPFQPLPHTFLIFASWARKPQSTRSVSKAQKIIAPRVKNKGETQGIEG